MNKAEIESLKNKIIECDKIIHVQQLGVVWEPPQNYDPERSLAEDFENESATRGNLSSADGDHKEEHNKSRTARMEDEESEVQVELDEGQYDVNRL